MRAIRQGPFTYREITDVDELRRLTQEVHRKYGSASVK